MSGDYSKLYQFEKILDDIKSVKIQGAENVAKAGIDAFLLSPKKSSVKKILSLRPTEPLLKNSLSRLLKSPDPKLTAKLINKYLSDAHKKISMLGASLIKNNMNIYTHCHSSTVIDILKYAKLKLKKKFVVYTSEVEPLLQGRMTAEDLSRSKIKVVITPDLAAEHSIKNCDLLFFGVDAFTPKFVANKIGTSTLVNLAGDYGVPCYSCGVSLKFTKKVVLEQRPSKEVWDKKHKLIKVLNPAFDKTRLSDLSGVISEFGILRHKSFIRSAKLFLKKF